MADFNGNVIQNDMELGFAIFCIENVAIHLNVAAEKVYDAMTLESDILNCYIIPNFDVLHTQGKGYIVDDIIETMAERGITI